MELVHGFILKKNIIGEDNLSILFFTKEVGKISVFVPHGKKSKRRFMGKLELLKELELKIHETKNKNLILEEAKVINDHTALSRKLDKFFSYCYCLELIDRTVQFFQRESNLYLLLKKYLSYIEEHNSLVSTIRFQNSFLKLVGWYPELSRCNLCKRKTTELKVDIYLLPEFNGIVCKNCYNKDRINRVSLEEVEFLLNPKDNLDRDKGLNLFYVLNNFIEFHLERELSTFKITYECLKKVRDDT